MMLGIKSRKNGVPCGNAVFMESLLSVQVLDYVANSHKLVNVVIVDGKIELLLAEHDKVGQLNGIQSKIRCQLGVKGDGVGIDLELLGQKLLQGL